MPEATGLGPKQAEPTPRAIASGARSAPDPGEPSAESGDSGRLVELGWVLAGDLDPEDRVAVDEARRALLARLRALLPQFEWRMPVVPRRDVEVHQPAEPVLLLDRGVEELDLRRWDFALVVTKVELRTYLQPFAYAVPSRAVSCGVISTARLDPAATRIEVEDEGERAGVMGRRIEALAMHLLGHLTDLPHVEDPRDFMSELGTLDDLDRIDRLSPEALARMRAELELVADLRLEEIGPYRGRGGRHGEWRRLRFTARALLHNRGDVLRSLLNMRPWLIPLRLSRLTTAGASALLVLIMTAEAWEVGMTEPPLRVVAVSLVALVGTTAYILLRQRLLVHTRGERLSEQRVVGNAAVTLAVLVGMATTYALLFGVTLLLSTTLYAPDVVAGWTPTLAEPPALEAYARLAGMIASLGITIGALGASFEAQGYVRHVAYVDEET